MNATWKGLIAAGLALFAQPAGAVTITNLTTNTVLFSDDFESAPSVATIDYAHLGGGPDANPVAPIGSWYVNEQMSDMVQVVDTTTGGDPGPNEGANYLRAYRNGGASRDSLLVLAGAGSLQETAGDRIRLDFMAWIGDGATARLSATILGPFGVGINGVGNDRGTVYSENGRVMAYTGLGVVDTGLTFAERTWQRWSVEYVIGGDTFSVAVNGASAGGFKSATIGGVASALIYNGNPAEGVFYLDKASPAPEPAMLGTACLGALAAAGSVSRRARPG